MAQMLFSSGVMSGCYFQIQQEDDYHIRATVSTPVADKEAVVTNYEYAKKWVDQQVASYLRLMNNED